MKMYRRDYSDMRPQEFEIFIHAMLRTLYRLKIQRDSTIPSHLVSGLAFYGYRKQRANRAS